MEVDYQGQLMEEDNHSKTYYFMLSFRLCKYGRKIINNVSNKCKAMT